MEKSLPSIFNDVIGPVMRGPSSSHVAAAARIGQFIRMATEGDMQQVLVYFDPSGSLPESYHGHGSDIGLVGGLLGLELTDSRVIDALVIAKDQGLDVQFIIQDYGATHPNHYRIETTSKTGEKHLWEAISTGGGMVEMQAIDGYDVTMSGDYHELVVLVDNEHDSCVNKWLTEHLPECDFLQTSKKQQATLINAKTTAAVPPSVLASLSQIEGVLSTMTMAPLLPTRSTKNSRVPFRTARELLEYAKTSDREMWQMATLYESARGLASEEEVFKQMYDLCSIMRNCVKEGLAGTQYEDRILGAQAFKMEKLRKVNPLFPTDLLSNIIRNVTAAMEVKSAFGVIVAAPTAGSCGCLLGAITGAGETLGYDQEAMTKALLAAGLIGVFVAEQATFAAEVAGCQAECGAGSSMAAAGLVQLLGGTVEQCVDAASLAMQNITGLVCDPVANRVEVPCLGKNVMGASNGVASAAMILAGYDKVIPLDETILAMYDIGLKLPAELRCTLGGLGKTKTSLEIRKRLS